MWVVAVSVCGVGVIVVKGCLFNVSLTAVLLNRVEGVLSAVLFVVVEMRVTLGVQLVVV